jgi:protein arginine kinase
VNRDSDSARLGELAREIAGWLDGSGPETGTVLSSRVRLARNVENISFPHRASPEELSDVLAQVDLALTAFDPERVEFPWSFRMTELDEVDRSLLLERHLVGRELTGDADGRAVMVGAGETMSLMVNEEDHLRIQSIHSGLALTSAWEDAVALDRSLEAELTLAFSDDWGYLTACPTNTGTGLRASVLLHLPGLVLTKQIHRVLQGVAQVGLAVRGFYGEGSEVMGNFFQVSNQTALGRSEEEVIESLDRVVRTLVDKESQARQVLLRDARPQVEDKIWRAHGILRHCRSVSSEEVLGLASAVRLGVASGVVPQVSTGILNRLLLLTQPAHLQKMAGRPMDSIERDVRRAELTRALMREAEGNSSGLDGL